MSYRRLFFVVSYKLFKSRFTPPEIEITVVALRIYQPQIIKGWSGQYPALRAYSA